MDKININGKDYNLKYSVRSLFLFEQITKKSFKIETLLDNYVFFYCLILANNRDNTLEWDEFIDAMDEDETLFKRMSDIVTKQQKKNELFEENETNDDGEKKS